MSQTAYERFAGGNPGPAPYRDSEGVKRKIRRGEPLPVKKRPPSFRVESGHEPPDRRGFEKECKYPWPDMEEGQSFYLRDEDMPPSGSSSVAGNGREWCQRNRPEMTVLRKSEGGGCRFWMVRREEP